MRKFSLVLIVALVSLFGVAGAHSFTVGVDWAGSLDATAEVAVEVGGGTEVLFGVQVDPFAFDADVTLGVATPPLVVEGAEFSLVARVGVPVFDGGVLSVGQVVGSVGLQALLTDSAGLATPVVEVGARSALDSNVFGQLPGIYVRGGIVFGF